MKYRGAAYYPEYWPEERWDEDVRLMRAAHFNLVRIGEFAWTAMEPAEGNYTLDWLHSAFRKLGDAGINVLLCTPSATPPAWLTQAYPETLMVLADGTRKVHGTRRHYCPTHPRYREFCRAITGKLVDEFGGYANLAGWQLDNELGPERGRCHCEHCQAEYRRWLQARYGSLDGLNDAWKTRFWSMTFTDWDQVRLATADMYPSMRLDTRRFQSDAYVDFARNQTRVIRAKTPDALVTTNGMGPLFEPINYYDLFADLDRAAADTYFDIANLVGDALSGDAFQSYLPDRPWWMTETGSGALTADKVPAAGQLRAWAFSALARGCEAWCIFRWRTALSGQEQELQGIIEHSGKPRRRYAAVQALFAELEQVGPELTAAPLPTAEVALVFDYDVDWGYNSAFISDKIAYKRLWHEVYGAFHRRNIPVQVIPPGRPLDGYKLVVLPSVTMIDPAFAETLRAFVAGGGTVLSLPQLACRDRNNNYFADTPPVGLQSLFGLHVEGGMYLRSYVNPDEALWFPQPHYTDETPAVRCTLAAGAVTGTVRTWMEDIVAEGGNVLGAYTDNTFTGDPFLVEHHHGAGRTLYLGAYPTGDLFDAVIDEALVTTGLTALPSPQDVEIIPRGDYLFAINHTNAPVRVYLPAGAAVVGVFEDGQAFLGPYDVCVVKR
jgi:beta-galactosidase